MNLIEAAQGVAPELEWVEASDPMAAPGGAEYVGASVGLVDDTAGTVTLARFGHFWVAELYATRGHYKTPEGEQSIVIAVKAADSPRLAWEELIRLCDIGGSFELGLEAARAARPGNAAPKNRPLSIRDAFKATP
jgi:hypothetical protein